MQQLRFVLLATAIALSACATQVKTTGTYIAPAAQSGVTLPPPHRAIVSGFASLSGVALDSGVGARLQRQFGSQGVADQQAAIAGEVQQTIIDTLVSDLTAMGIPAAPAQPGAAYGNGAVLVQGDVVSITQGNRTRRLLVGFGAGKSDVQATAQVYYVSSDATPRLLETYSADSNSGRKPGLGIGAASSVAESTVIPLAASTVLNAHNEVKKAGVAGEAQRLAHRISYNLGKLFVAQGWIDRSRAPSLGLR